MSSFERGDDRATMFKRHEDTSKVVQGGLMAVSALLSLGSNLPLVGQLCEAAQGCLDSADEFKSKAKDVTIAARRVCDVLDIVYLMAQNVDRLEEKALVESKMRRLVDLLVEFNKAVRAFGKKGWMKRAWKMRGHVNSLGRLDKEIVAQLDVFRDVYKLATDNESMKRIYKIEASIDKLVAERVRQTGEPEGKVVAVLSNDPVAIASVAVDARVPPTELATELSEFRLEVKAGLSNLDKKMQQMLDGKQGDREEIAKVLAAVKAGVTRDKKLLAAVKSGAARDRKMLAAVQRNSKKLDNLKAAVQAGIERLATAARRRDAKLDDFMERDDSFMTMIMMIITPLSSPPPPPPPPPEPPGGVVGLVVGAAVGAGVLATTAGLATGSDTSTTVIPMNSTGPPSRAAAAAMALLKSKPVLGTIIAASAFSSVS